MEQTRRNAPENEGIYEFGVRVGRTTEIVYIGKGTGSRGIRSRVISHINGSSSGNRCIFMLIQARRNVKVRWEECTLFGQSAESLEQEALEDFIEKFGDLPICNQKLERDQHSLWDEIVRFFK